MALLYRNMYRECHGPLSPFTLHSRSTHTPRSNYSPLVVHPRSTQSTYITLTIHSQSPHVLLMVHSEYFHRPLSPLTRTIDSQSTHVLLMVHSQYIHGPLIVYLRSTQSTYFTLTIHSRPFTVRSRCNHGKPSVRSGKNPLPVRDPYPTVHTATDMSAQNVWPERDCPYSVNRT
jgi:hypothetical protein